jgi:hypothetical protein
VVALLLTVWRLIEPPYRRTVAFNNSVERRYIWRSGLAITISQDGFELPSIKIETGTDISGWEN